MEHINVFIVQLAIILVPGIVWARIDVRFASIEKPSEVEFLLRAFLYGLVSYAVTAALYTLTRHRFAVIDVAQADTHDVITPAVGKEIIAATAISFLMGVLWVYASTWKIMSRLLQLIWATKRYGDEDVWDFTFNSRSPSVQFINLRDFEK